MVDYFPNQGDIVWLEFEPQKGKEINKIRPALVVSPQKYNKKTGLALFMPITRQIKEYPFEFLLKGKKVEGVILCDQIRSLDWKARKASYLDKISAEQYIEIIEKFSVLLTLIP